jgi:hypothetical protein
VIISLVNKAITAITSRLQSLSQFDGTESKVIFLFSPQCFGSGLDPVQ